MEKYLLSVKNLKKNYQTINDEIIAVDNFNLDLKEKEFVVIIGPSGCGKSTILSIIGELEKETEGKIYKNGNIKTGYMLQNDSLFEWRNILQNCCLGLEIKNKKNKENIKYVKELINKYELSNFINKYPSNLSGGMRQRVALIRTLAIKPDILLLDEPFSALDYQTRLKVSNDVYTIIRKEGKSAIMVTHDISEAISMADRIIVLSKRPAKIKKEFLISFNSSLNPIEKRNNEKFKDYFEKIWKEID